ncbi:MAG: hypothetical protein Q9224_002814 [Gallowayella concinna]
MEPISFPLKTEAFVVQEPKAGFKLTPIILDEVRPDEVLVEMKYTGICHTDIVLQQGLLPMVDFPAVFGHEGAGIVRAIGSSVKNKSLVVGDNVLLSFTVCGECKQCKSDHPSYCHSHAQINHGAVRRDGSTPGKLIDGGSVRSQYFGQSSFSKMSVVSEKCVVKCPYPESMAVFSPLGCGFQTGAGTILNVLKPQAQQSLVVAGIGGVGLAAVMAAKYLCVQQVIAVDLVDERLQLGQELGATHVINSKRNPDVVQSIKDITDGGADFAVDCTGVVPVIEMLIECIGPRGVAATVGVPPAGKKIQIDPLAFLLENKTYVGVIEGDSVPDTFIPQLMELHRTGNFPIERLCKVYPIDQLETALNDLKSGRVIKPVIKY